MGEAGEVLIQDSDTFRVINPGKMSRGYVHQKHLNLEKYWQRNRGNTGALSLSMDNRTINSKKGRTWSIFNINKKYGGVGETNSSGASRIYSPRTVYEDISRASICATVLHPYVILRNQNLISEFVSTR